MATAREDVQSLLKMTMDELKSRLSEMSPDSLVKLAKVMAELDISLDTNEFMKRQAGVDEDNPEKPRETKGPIRLVKT